MTEARPIITPEILQNSFRIAWDYLEATGDLVDRDLSARFLLDEIESMMGRGERRPLMLSNKAIDAYRRARTQRTLALVS